MQDIKVQHARLPDVVNAVLSESDSVTQAKRRTEIGPDSLAGGKTSEIPPGLSLSSNMSSEGSLSGRQNAREGISLSSRPWWSSKLAAVTTACFSTISIAPVPALGTTEPEPSRHVAVLTDSVILPVQVRHQERLLTKNIRMHRTTEAGNGAQSPSPQNTALGWKEGRFVATHTPLFLEITTPIEFPGYPRSVHSVARFVDENVTRFEFRYRLSSPEIRARLAADLQLKGLGQHSVELEDMQSFEATIDGGPVEQPRAEWFTDCAVILSDSRDLLRVLVTIPNEEHTSFSRLLSNGRLSVELRFTDSAGKNQQRIEVPISGRAQLQVPNSTRPPADASAPTPVAEGDWILDPLSTLASNFEQLSASLSRRHYSPSRSSAQFITGNSDPFDTEMSWHRHNFSVLAEHLLTMFDEKKLLSPDCRRSWSADDPDFIPAIDTVLRSIGMARRSCSCIQLQFAMHDPFAGEPYMRPTPEMREWAWATPRMVRAEMDYLHAYSTYLREIRAYAVQKGKQR